MRASLVPVCDCRGETTDHRLLGANSLGRPVWECLECGETRVGPYVPGVDRGAAGELAADGGIEK